MEAALLERMVPDGKPVLGICYGCQFLNVWRGGTLVQDIPAEWPDPIEHGNARHNVHLSPGTRLFDMLGRPEYEIRSSHHQAVARLAPGAHMAAVAPDEVVEAIEFSEAPFLVGVQWHPEVDPEVVTTRLLFQALVDACRSG